MAFDLWGISENAKAGRKAATAERVAAENEAAQLEARAKGTLAEGSYNSDRIGKKVAEILAQRRAMAAAGNGSASDQSEMAIQAETIREASIDQLLVMAQAQDDAVKDRYGAQVRRETGMRQADLIKTQTRAKTISSVAGLANDWVKTFG